NTWTTVASLPDPRSLLAAATGPDGRIYVIGGLIYDPDRNTISTVYAYTPSTNTWAQVASLPAPRSHLAATTGPDGRLYALGGDRQDSDNALVTVTAYTAVPPSTGTASTMVSVADAPLTVLGPPQPIAAVEGQPVTNVSVATFTDADPG